MSDDDLTPNARLRRTLAEASVITVRVEPLATRSAAGIVIPTLEGGVEAFWKRGDFDPPGVLGVRREVAAYELALLLEWDDLLPVIAHRSEATSGGGVAEVASIELLPQGVDDLDVHSFPVEAVERAGVFDALVGHTDRAGHNWRGIPDAGSHILKLYDHESAFGVSTGVGPSSSFWTHIGAAVPAPLKAHLAIKLGAVSLSPELATLLPPDELEALVTRMEQLSETQRPAAPA